MHLSVLLFHQAPSPILVIDLAACCRQRNSKAEGNFETLMLMDHLSAQKTPELLAIFKHCRTSAAFGPRNQTHAWQPIDRGHLGPPEMT